MERTDVHGSCCFAHNGDENARVAHIFVALLLLLLPGLNKTLLRSPVCILARAAAATRRYFSGEWPGRFREWRLWPSRPRGCGTAPRSGTAWAWRRGSSSRRSWPPPSTASASAWASRPRPPTTSANAWASRPRPSTTSASEGASTPRPSGRPRR